MHRAWIWLAACLLLLSVAAAAETIAEVKSSPAGTQVTVEGIVTYTEPDECYIEAPDRSSGIWVLGPMGTIGVGNGVTASGTFNIVMGEAAIIDASICLQQTLPITIRPFGVSNRSLGGASNFSSLCVCDFQPWAPLGWFPSCGANNVGLLVTISGAVRSICDSGVNGAKWLYIDDGSGLTADFGDLGVLVYSDAEVQMGDRVTITGVSSTEPSMDDPTRLVRVIRTRDANDVQVIAHCEGLAPASAKGGQQ